MILFTSLFMSNITIFYIFVIFETYSPQYPFTFTPMLSLHIMLIHPNKNKTLAPLFIGFKYAFQLLK